MTFIRTELRAILKLACKVFASREMTIRPQGAGLPMASLQENRTVLTYLHPIRVFRNETYIAGQMTNKSICRACICSGARTLRVRIRPYR